MVTPNNQRSFSSGLGTFFFTFRFSCSARRGRRRLRCSNPGRVRLKLPDQVLEDTSAMLVVFELVKASARRREQDDVTGTRGARCTFDCTVESIVARDSH